MRIQIRTLQVPPKAAGAFMPTLTFGGAPVTNGQNSPIGQPGTVRVASPRPAALSDGELGGPLNQPSSLAPNWFLPSIYFYRLNPSLRFKGKIFSDNVVPVPAQDVSRIPRQWQHKARIGGRTATSNPRAFITWPTYNRQGY